MCLREKVVPMQADSVNKLFLTILSGPTLLYRLLKHPFASRLIGETVPQFGRALVSLRACLAVRGER